jgi:hypothetical protein
VLSGLPWQVVFGAIIYMALAALSSSRSFLYSLYHFFIYVFVPPVVSYTEIYATFNAISYAEGIVADS